MSFEITKVARNLRDQIDIKPQLILLIDGIPFKFGTADVLRYPKFDEGYLFDSGLYFDTPFLDAESRPYISLSGSSNQITSQLIPEKGGSGSVQSFRIVLVNINTELTEYFTSGNNIPDILGRDAKVFLGFVGGAYPVDFIKIFDGFIDDFVVAHNTFEISVAIPTQRVRQKLFNLISTKLSLAITNTDLTIPVDSTLGFTFPTVEQEEYLLSYIKIDDEIIKLSQTNTATEFQSVLRNQLITIANPHDDEAEVTTFFRLRGNPIQLALRLLMSQPTNEYFIEDLPVDRFVVLSGLDTIANSIYLKTDVLLEYNISEGDLISSYDAINPENNFTDRLVSQIVQTSEGSYLIVTGAALVLESLSTAKIKVKSRYNTLPIGLGMIPNYMDLEGIAFIDTLIGASLSEVDIYIKEEIDAKEWLEKEIYKPCGLFALNRKGRYSIYAALPPLNIAETTFLNQDSIVNMSSIRVRRSTEKNHYNSIVYKFEEDSLEDKFAAGVVVVSQNSINRIPVGNKQLTIEAKALRDDSETRNAITRQAERLIDKYQFAPQYIEGVQTNFKTGYTLEVGDSVVFGGSGVLLPNLEKGLNYFPETLMEISNKSINLRQGIITFDLINSSFGLNARYGVISPSSYTKSYSGDTLEIKSSFGSTILDLESDKWVEMIGRPLRIRDVNFTQSQVLTLQGISDEVENTLIFSENITIPVMEDFIVELAEYDDLDDYQKASYVALNPQEEVISFISPTELEIDSTNLFVGATLLIHNEDYSNTSQEVTIDSILGNNITLSEALTYNPIAGDLVELIGFKSDEGLPYRYI